MKKMIFLILFLSFSSLLQGQIDTTAVKTIKGITDKMIEIISGDIDEERNWDAYRNLFLPTAQKASIRISRDGKTSVRSLNLEEFIRNTGPLYARDGFEEYALGLTVNEYNGIAVVFQSYYCRNLIGTYEKRGINSYQLVYMDDRWWIANTLFTAEDPENPIPEKFLNAGKE